MKRKNRKKISRAEKKTVKFRMRARNEIELRIIVFLSEARFEYETRTACRRRYWSTEIRRYGAGIGFRIFRNGNVEMWAADEIHGMSRVTLVRKDGSDKNAGKTLEILKQDAAFFLRAFCSTKWYDLMEHLEECREHGVEDWKRGCGLYHEYVRILREVDLEAAKSG